MNDFARLLARQLSADARTLPARTRTALNPPAASRAGTIGELRAAAFRRVPKVVFDYVDGGAGDEITLRRNLAAFRAIGFRPRVLTDVSDVDTATSALGEPIALPLIGAPMGLMGLLNPAGEVAAARALHEAGTISILSVMASCAVEEVTAAAKGPVWFQMYLWRDRGLLKEMLDRVKAAGVQVLVVTVDVPCAGNRDRDRRNGFTVPPRVTARALADGMTHPRWSFDFVRNPRISWGNLHEPAAAASLSEGINQQFDPAATWADLAWFRDHWNGRLVLKGVLDPRDARRAVDAGADALVVSNHGGRQLDGAEATISALPAVADAVAGDAEIYLDSGIRRGADLAKAVALGARACLAGRPLAYGLGAAGQAGVRRAVDILHAELRTVLALIGCPTLTDLDPTWLTRP
jgi:L-lactate dehydrogenase (cytochrome)